MFIIKYSSIAQSVERMTVNHDVTGSSPVGGAKKEYSLSTVGVDDAGSPPVPIPNTEVKPCSAENSSLATGCEKQSYYSVHTVCAVGGKELIIMGFVKKCMSKILWTNFGLYDRISLNRIRFCGGIRRCLKKWESFLIPE